MHGAFNYFVDENCSAAFHGKGCTVFHFKCVLSGQEAARSLSYKRRNRVSEVNVLIN